MAVIDGHILMNITNTGLFIYWPVCVVVVRFPGLSVRTFCGEVIWFICTCIWVFNRFVIGFLLFCLFCVEEDLRSASRHAYSY